MFSSATQNQFLYQLSQFTYNGLNSISSNNINRIRATSSSTRNKIRHFRNNSNNNEQIISSNTVGGSINFLNNTNSNIQSQNLSDEQHLNNQNFIKNESPHLSVNTNKENYEKSPLSSSNNNNSLENLTKDILNKILDKYSSNALNLINVGEGKQQNFLKEIQNYLLKNLQIVEKQMFNFEQDNEDQISKSSFNSSYKSFGSFELDKNFPSSPFTSKFLKDNNSTLLLPSSFTSNLIQMRTFKTDRNVIAENKRNPSMLDRFKNKFFPQRVELNRLGFGGLKDSSGGDVNIQNEKLKSMIGELPQDEANKIKIAFAEGYLANQSGGTAGGGNSKTYRWLRTLQQILAIAVFTAILASLMGSFGSGMFRVNVGNGSEVFPEDINVTFDDVKGVEEAKQELQEVVEFLRNPEKFVQLGGKLPKGVLLVGPPGTGKTLLARAVAGEASVPFFHAAGPEFDEILVGQGARRVRDLFKAAKAKAPCVVFIDEIDSVGAKRTNSVLHPYANQTINQLLSEMDGFRQNEGVIVLGATNRREDLDRALLRPGRFDVEVQVSPPEYQGRKDILEYYLSKVKVSDDIDIDKLARGTTGFTGADLENMVNQSALRAAIEEAESVTKKHLDFARDKVIMGPERKSRIPDVETNKITAYHEAGHTLVAHFTKDANPLHKVTIIPRGQSMGHTAYIPDKEQYHITRSQLQAMMDTMMGGRAAEELIFGNDKVTSGASSDLKQATSIATHMVKEWGMSEKVGFRTILEDKSSFVTVNELGPATSELIDSEIKRILQESYDRAINILKIHSKEHKALAEALIKYESLDADDVKAILSGNPPKPMSSSILPASSTRPSPGTTSVNKFPPPQTPPQNKIPQC